MTMSRVPYRQPFQINFLFRSDKNNKKKPYFCKVSEASRALTSKSNGTPCRVKQMKNQFDSNRNEIKARMLASLLKTCKSTQDSNG